MFGFNKKSIFKAAESVSLTKINNTDWTDVAFLKDYFVWHEDNMFYVHNTHTNKLVKEISTLNKFVHLSPGPNNTFYDYYSISTHVKNRVEKDILYREDNVSSRRLPIWSTDNVYLHRYYDSYALSKDGKITQIITDKHTVWNYWFTNFLCSIASNTTICFYNPYKERMEYLASLQKMEGPFINHTFYEPDTFNLIYGARLWDIRYTSLPLKTFSCSVLGIFDGNVFFEKSNSYLCYYTNMLDLESETLLSDKNYIHMYTHRDRIETLYLEDGMVYKQSFLVI